MSTPNFKKLNTHNYCVLLDEYHTDDYDFMLKNLGDCAEDCGFFSTSDYNRSMEMSVFAERGGYENKYNTALTEIDINTQLGVISGYYADSTIDFDIKVTPSISGYNYRLSDFGSIFEMVESILSDMEAEASWGDEDWNYGIWKMNRKHVQTWLINLITKEYEDCNKFCEENSDTRLMCIGVFGNGEAVYQQAM